MELPAIIFQVGLVVAILFTSMQWVKKDAWWVRVADFPHVQTTVLTIQFLAGTIVFGDWSNVINLALIAAGLFILGYQLKIIYPYTPLSPKQAKDWSGKGTTQLITIMESNVYQFNEEHQPLLDLVAKVDPDILILLETDQKWCDATKSLDAKFPYRIKHPLENTYGVLFFSKLKILKHEIQFIIEEDIPSIEADLESYDGNIIRFYVVHPEPPSPTENYRSTERDAELILIGNRAKRCRYPVIVAGDLNDVAWSHTTRLFQRVSGLLDPRIGRGFFNTFNANHRLFRWPLDHVFHSHHFLIKEVRRLPRIGSDHFPMLISLSQEDVNGVFENESVESVDEDDKVESIEKIVNARA